ncbi:hypothetical protein FRB96_001574 [Tulasnella sp. 330]|nr:hypothetical protein FRB96_001574 [Tulasnella sp. 330]
MADRLQSPGTSSSRPLASLPIDITAILDLVDVPPAVEAGDDDDGVEDMDMDTETELLERAGRNRGSTSDSEEVDRALILDEGDGSDESDQDGLPQVDNPTTPAVMNHDADNTSVKLGVTPLANGAIHAVHQVDVDACDSESSSDWRSASSSSGDEANKAKPPRAKRSNTKSYAKLSAHIRSMDSDADADVSDDGEGPSISGPLKTANEILVPEVEMPSIELVDEGDMLEFLGEVMSIIDSVVVVKGSSGNAGEKVLDTGSLLAWDDRKVLGMVFETFGPTTLPLYSVRFPSAQAIDRDIVTVSRKVFHVPAKSHYVFTRALKQLKGSDASNIFDEEVGEDDMEFSDDEQEAEHKRALREKRSERRNDNEDLKGPASRHAAATPHYLPSHDIQVDDGDVPFTSEAYGDASRPIRTAPAPYDDYLQYGKEHEEGETNTIDGATTSTSFSAQGPSAPPSPVTSLSDIGSYWGRGRGGGSGSGERGRGRGRTRERGRGRGRSSAGGERGPGGGRGRGRGGGFQPQGFPPAFPSFTLNMPLPSNAMPFQPPSAPYEEYDPRHPQMASPLSPTLSLPLRPSSPTSLTIARATGGPMQMGQMNDMNGVPISPINGSWDMAMGSQLANMQQQFFAMSNMAMRMAGNNNGGGGGSSDFGGVGSGNESGRRRSSMSSNNTVSAPAPAPHINPNFLMGNMGIGAGLAMSNGMHMQTHWGFPANMNVTRQHGTMRPDFGGSFLADLNQQHSYGDQYGSGRRHPDPSNDADNVNDDPADHDQQRI